MKKLLEEEPQDFAPHTGIRDLFGSTSRRVFTSHPVALELEGLNLQSRRRGEEETH